jgi:hypothetical protein
VLPRHRLTRTELKNQSMVGGATSRWSFGTVAMMDTKSSWSLK